jgi:pentatricopeptide repeat protein
MNDLTSLDALALEMIVGAQSAGGAKPAGGAQPAGGDKIGDFLKSPSGEGNLTCEQALSAHCSAKCTNGALELLRGMQKKGK